MRVDGPADEAADIYKALGNISQRAPQSFQKMQRLCNQIIVRDLDDRMGQCRPVLQLLGDKAIVVSSGMSIRDLEETIVHEILGHQSLGPFAALFGEGNAEDIEERYWAGELP
jgi:hypothetical protein